MKAVLLIGGQATRLFPLSKYVAKSLLPVCDRELLHYQITQIALAGISEIVLAAGHHVEQLSAFVGGYGGGLDFAVSLEPEPLGTAGAIANAMELIEDDSAVVLNADILSAVSLKSFVEAHRSSGRSATILGIPVRDPSRYGLLQVNDHNITGFTEKPEQQLGLGPHYINGGMYALEPAALAAIPQGRSISIERETFPQLIEQHGPLNLYPFEGMWIDVGTFESYFRANFELLARRYTQGEDWLWGSRNDSAIFKDLIYINNSCRLGKSVDLYHRVMLMSAVEIGDGCRLRNTLVLPGARIGNAVHIEDTIIGPGVGVVDERTVKNAILVQGEPDLPFYPEAE
jgi:mannose-1-phosphate guanylyltransferase